MKRRLGIICLIAALFFGCVGCDQDVEQAKETTLSTEETLPHNGEERTHSQQSMVEFDPDREIYIACQNQYADYYANCYGDISFMIMSREKLDKDQIEVTVPCENEYSVDIGEIIVQLQTREEIDMYYPEFLYYCYTDFDFEEYTALMLETGEDNYRSLEEYALLDEFKAPYYAAYLELTPEDIPVFYVYPGHIYFFDENDEPTIKVDEIISEMDFVIEGVTYHEEIGELRIHSEKLATVYTREDTLPALDGEFGGSGGPAGRFGDDFWNEQINQYTIRADATVTGFHVLTGTCENLELYVSHTSGNQTMEFSWDGVTPFDVYKGDTLSISARFTNSFMDEFWYNTLFVFEVDYMTNGKMGFDYDSVTFYPLCAIMDYSEYFERFAVVFDGLDLSLYFGAY